MKYEKYWETKEGEELVIKDMETYHIENCIKFLERKIKNGETIRIYGGMDWFDSVPWYDEEDITDELKNYIRTFKHVLKTRKDKMEYERYI